MRYTKGFVGAVAVVLGLTLTASPLSAHKGAAKRAAAKKGRQAQDNVLVAHLQSAYRIIEKADPIYKGHRAKAMHEIKAAIGHLQKEMHRRGLKPHHIKHGITESKAASDGDINAGLKQVNGILSELNAVQSTTHRSRAVSHLGTAVKELKTALAVVKAKKK